MFSFFAALQQPAIYRSQAILMIGPLGGRPYPVVMRMTDLSEQDHWTELRYSEGEFDLELPDFLFTLSNLSNPRSWTRP